MSHRLALLTVVYKNYTVLDDFLKSISSQTSPDFHLYIADASPEKKEINTMGLAVTIIPIENKGYAYGVNVATQKAVADGLTEFCVMNNDTYLAPDFVEKSLSSLKAHPKSLISGKIYYAKGFEYHKDRYTPEELGKVFWYAGGKYFPEHATVAHRGVDCVDRGQFDTFEKTEFVSGCMMLYDKNALDIIGNWDESYFLYYEDTDFSMRAVLKNIPLWYDPSLVMWHKNAQSTDGSGSSIHSYYLEKNHVTFALKYAPLRTKLHVVKNYATSSLSRFFKKKA